MRSSQSLRAPTVASGRLYALVTEPLYAHGTSEPRRVRSKCSSPPTGKPPASTRRAVRVLS
jgi:hypothetical protein